jgi:hypothetical protein
MAAHQIIMRHIFAHATSLRSELTSPGRGQRSLHCLLTVSVPSGSCNSAMKPGSRAQPFVFLTKPRSSDGSRASRNATTTTSQLPSFAALEVRRLGIAKSSGSHDFPYISCIEVKRKNASVFGRASSIREELSTAFKTSMPLT